MLTERNHGNENVLISYENVPYGQLSIIHEQILTILQIIILVKKDWYAWITDIQKNAPEEMILWDNLMLKYINQFQNRDIT